jgi:hypothetical protein
MMTYVYIIIAIIRLTIKYVDVRGVSFINVLLVTLCDMRSLRKLFPQGICREPSVLPNDPKGMKKSCSDNETKHSVKVREANCERSFLLVTTSWVSARGLIKVKESESVTQAVTDNKRKWLIRLDQKVQRSERSEASSLS